MATLPNVPPILDQARITFYTVSSSTSVFSVGFPVFGTGEDIDVYVNGVLLSSANWTFSSASGTSLPLLPLPITDGQITLGTAISTGTLAIVGSWNPRQTIQPSAPGIARREFNQTISMLIAGLREAVTNTMPFVPTDSIGDGFFNAQGHLISNVADAVSNQDAVNLETLNAKLAAFGAFVSSLSSSDGSITVSAPTGTVTISVNSVALGKITGLGSGVGAALATGVNGTGAISLTTNASFVTPNLGTPSAVNLSNASNLPLSAIPSLGSGVATALADATNSAGGITTYPPNVANIAGMASGVSTVLQTAPNTTGGIATYPVSAGSVAVGAITGMGSGVAAALAIQANTTGGFATYPTSGGGGLSAYGTPTINQLATWQSSTAVQGITTGTGVTTALGVNVGSAGAFITNGGAAGTPSSITLTYGSGLPISGITGLGSGVPAALAVGVGSAGAFVTFNGALGTPSSGTLTSCSGLPISTGVSGLGTGVATALAAAPTGSGGVVLATSPTLVTPNLGTPSAGSLGSCTNYSASNLAGLGTGVATALAAAVNTTNGIATYPVSGSAFPGAIAGLLPTTWSGSSNSTAAITVSAGSAADSTAAAVLKLSTSGSWAVSNGNAINGYQGGFLLPNSSTVHMFICYGGSGTGLFASTSLSPTLPSGYNTYYRRIFSFTTNSSGVMNTYVADEVEGGAYVAYLSTPVSDYNSNGIGTTRSLVTVSVPTGVKVKWAGVVAPDNNSNYSIIATSPDEPASSPTSTSSGGYSDAAANNAVTYTTTGRNTRPLVTNASAQFYLQASASSSWVVVWTAGWTDSRRT